MNQIIPVLFEGMTTDEENLSEELVGYYNGVTPGQRAAMKEMACTRAVELVVGALEGEVAQRGELGLDAVEPGAVEGHVDQPDVVHRRPLTDPAVGLGGQVGAKVVQHDLDPHVGRVQRAQVAAKVRNSVRPLLVFTWP